jgi:hypothetical protein
VSPAVTTLPAAPLNGTTRISGAHTVEQRKIKAASGDRHFAK